MTARYSQAHAQVDPHARRELPNGAPLQQIELVFTGDPNRPSWRALGPAVCALDAGRARELAFELLMLAEVAEQWEQAR